MILDATAGNRAIWRKKESPHILWIDIEPELEIPPDMVLDCTATGFEAGRFHTIFFDPPHGWGKDPNRSWTTIRNMKEREEYPWKPPSQLSYWGWEKYKSKSALLAFIHKAQKEFNRILTPDGILWVKWNEVNIPLSPILPLFRNWDEMMRLTIGSKNQTLGETQTYWVMFMKKANGLRQAELMDS